MIGGPVTNKLLILTITISKKTNLFFFCERAFNTNNLSKIRENTFGIDTVKCYKFYHFENLQFGRVCGCSYGYWNKFRVHSIWLADVTFQRWVFDYSQLSDYTVPLQPYTMIREK